MKDDPSHNVCETCGAQYDPSLSPRFCSSECENIQGYGAARREERHARERMDALYRSTAGRDPSEGPEEYASLSWTIEHVQAVFDVTDADARSFLAMHDTYIRDSMRQTGWELIEHFGRGQGWTPVGDEETNPLCAHTLLEKPMNLPVIYEIDDAGTATGVVHFFCCVGCRSQSHHKRPDRINEGDNDRLDVPRGTRCETCGTEIEMLTA